MEWECRTRGSRLKNEEQHVHTKQVIATNALANYADMLYQLYFLPGFL